MLTHHDDFWGFVFVVFLLAWLTKHFVVFLILQGVFALSMVSMSGALMAKKEVLEPFLALILRDDLLSWHVSKASGSRTEEQQKSVRFVSDNPAVVCGGVWMLEVARCFIGKRHGCYLTGVTFFNSVAPSRRV